MKKLLLFAVVALVGCATVPVEQRQLEKVYGFPNTPKDTIYSKTLAWMAETFNSSKAVIELQDKENGKIIGHGMTSFTNVYVPIPCKYTIIIDVKDNKARLTYKDFIGMWGTYHENPSPISQPAQVNSVKEKLGILSDGYYQYMTNKKATNDW